MEFTSFRNKLFVFIIVCLPFTLKSQNSSFGLATRVPRAEIDLNFKHQTGKYFLVGTNLFLRHINTSSLRLKGFGIEGLVPFSFGSKGFAEAGLAHNFLFERFSAGTIEQQEIQALLNIGVGVKKFKFYLQTGFNYNYFYNIHFENNKSYGFNPWKEHNYLFAGFGISRTF